jgi:hypothetical protein
MGKLVIKRLNQISCLILFPAIIFGQNKSNKNTPLFIVSDIQKSHFYPKDTLHFTIKNRSQSDRGYTIEAIKIGNDSRPDQVFYSKVYTAYFNNDTTFLRKLNKSMRISKTQKTRYILPISKVNPNSIAADSVSIFFFVIYGKRIQNGIKIKFRVIPDIVEDEPDFEIETKPFWIHAKAM